MIAGTKSYLIPVSVAEAVEMAQAAGENFSFLAGGTDIMMNRQQGNGKYECLIDISGLEELKGVSSGNGNLRIGSLETLHSLQHNRDLSTMFPLLIEAALSVGSPLIRKTATIGGNVLCENRCLFYNQSEWWRDAIGYCLKCEGDICIATGGRNACFSEMVSDTAPALIAMDAQIEIIDSDGVAIMNLEDIYTGDGIKPRKLSPTAIIKAILLPLGRDFRYMFNKLRERESLEFTSLTTAVTIDNNQRLKIAMSGVDPKPVVVTGQPGDLPSDLISKAMKGARAVDNDMYSRTYRREMIRVFLERSFKSLQII